VGLRFRPQGLCFRPVGLRFRPQGLRFRPQGLRSSVFVFGSSFSTHPTILIALGDKFDPNDGDLLDFPSNFKCFTKVTAGNISRAIHELAHQELLINLSSVEIYHKCS